MREYAKQRDLEQFARDLAQLKENEKKTAAKSPAPPTMGKRSEFVYDSSKQLEVPFDS